MFSLRFCNRWVCFVILGSILCLSGLTGCGGSKKGATVSGTITYKGQTLGNGTVVFIAADNKGGSSPIAADGTYSISNLPVGPVKITVETKPLPPAPKMPNMANMPKIEMPGNEGASAGKYVKIPDRFKDPAQSGLTYEVKSGVQKHDIPLE